MSHSPFRLLSLVLAGSLMSCSSLNQESEVQIRDASARLGANAVHMVDTDAIVDAEPALHADLRSGSYRPRVETSEAAVRDLVVDPDPVASRALGGKASESRSTVALSNLVVDPDPVASRR